MAQKPDSRRSLSRTAMRGGNNKCCFRNRNYLGKSLRYTVIGPLTDYGGFLGGKQYLIHDRDPLYKSAGFQEIMQGSGITLVKLPARSPVLNCYAERFVKSVKFECLNHLILMIMLKSNALNVLADYSSRITDWLLDHQSNASS